jgi:hypothetical protein
MVANAGDINTSIEAALDRTAYLHALLGGGCVVSVLNFGADPTGAADSSPAFVAAHAAVLAFGGVGAVLAPAGAYKLDTGVTFNRGVSLIGDGAILLHNNVSQNMLTLSASGTATGAPRVVSGVAFESLLPTSGGAILDVASATPRELIIRDCSHNWSSDNIAGSFYTLPSAATSNVVIERCKLRARVNGEALVFANGGSNSHVEVAGGSFAGPAGDYATALLTLTDTPADVHGARFTLVGHGLGTAYCVETSGTLTAKKLRGCTFFQSGAGANIKAAGRLVEDDSDHTGGTRYDIAAELTAGSRLDLTRTISASSSSLGPFDLGALGLGVRNISYKLDADFLGGGPTFAMPMVLFAGQRFTLTVANKHASVGWNGITFTGGGQGNAGATSANRGRTFQFVALDLDNNGTTEWIVESDVSFDWIV